MRYDYKDELKKGLAEGLESAYTYMIDKYDQILFGYAFSLSHDRAIAQDIVQNVFLRIWEKRTELHLRNNLQSYLLKSVYHEFISVYRKNRPILYIESKYFEGLENTVSTTRDYDGIIAQVRAEINRLPPKCKAIFIMSKKEGLTNLEIANYLNISVKTVEFHITKAFVTLRENLKLSYTTLLLIFGSRVHNKRNFYTLGLSYDKPN